MVRYLYISRNFFVVLCLALLTGFTSFAQSADEPDAAASQLHKPAPLHNSAYYYPDFKKGKVVFINGAASAAVLNYNVLTEAVEYISTKKDTLAFDNMYLIDMITVANDTFFYDNRNACILKLLQNVNGWKLLVKESPRAGRQKASTLLHEPAIVTKAFYISNQTDYVPATTANFLKLFPAHAGSLQKYIAEHNLHLQTEEEINQVLRYVASL
ncbi:hypothetical protein H7F15_10710 [Pontibacter sp. Tf4]|uniref:hypothetical protein n=1 Tax=Pontibacter sp. Tf4 TaxID=2761620 RepID=UPI0016264074|nr:hypothetical protein [Pontibacter sp. Tf4]MBB6611508.1 hypothetical protein [Pontibacter sp. Tf4]